MIQRISFNGVYNFKDSKRPQKTEYYAAIKPMQIMQDNLYALNRGDVLIINHRDDGSYSFIMPDYMDSQFEKYCYYDGAQYTKPIRKINK